MRPLLALLAVTGCSGESRPAAPPPPSPTPVVGRNGPSTAAVMQLAVGLSHSCALHEDGTVSCWGLNTSKQLGIENLERSLVPIAVPKLTGVVEIAAEDHLTCARKADDTVHCWGALGESSEVAEPAQILDGVAQLAGRCFRMTNGTVQCLSEKAQIIPLTGIDNAVEMASWGLHGCVRRNDNTIRCWLDRDDKTYDVKVTDAAEVAVSQHGGCARVKSGSVSCWAMNAEMVDLGFSEYTNVRGIVSGRDKTCVRTESDIECWVGYDGEKKKLGAMPSAPLALGSHSCIGRGGRDVACWGEALEGELGNGWFRRRAVPTRVPGVEHVVEIAGANRDNATCARTKDRDVVCWGEFLEGADPKPKKIPVENAAAVVSSEGIRVIDDQHRLWVRDFRSYYDKADPTVTEIGVESASDQCFITTKGRMRCWRGYSTPDPKDPKYAIAPKIDDAVEVATFSEQGTACVRRKTGHVGCFHKGTDVLQDIAIDDAIAIAASEYAQCAIRSDHSLWCWGSTTSQIFGQRPEPVDIPPTQVPIGEVTALSMVRDNICVVRATGAVACWGQNTDGQLGDGTFMPRSHGADVIGITDAVGVHVGAGFACAVHRTGHVSCWGTTDRGQVGTHATSDVTTPTLVTWP